MDLRKIKSLVELMNENALAEVELDEEGMKVRLRKFGSGAPAGEPVPLPAAPSAPPVRQEPAGVEAPVKGHFIPSPMVGTFYRSPGPNTKPFVEAGATLGKETVVCIIEAMKVMNEIKAECEGVLEEVLAQNGQAVEFGQPLFRVRV